VHKSLGKSIPPSFLCVLPLFGLLLHSLAAASISFSLSRLSSPPPAAALAKFLFSRPSLFPPLVHGARAGSRRQRKRGRRRAMVRAGAARCGPGSCGTAAARPEWRRAMARASVRLGQAQDPGVRRLSKVARANGGACSAGERRRGSARARRQEGRAGRTRARLGQVRRPRRSVCRWSRARGGPGVAPAMQGGSARARTQGAGEGAAGAGSGAARGWSEACRRLVSADAGSGRGSGLAKLATGAGTRAPAEASNGGVVAHGRPRSRDSV
jgi:hypothetical protein